MVSVLAGVTPTRAGSGAATLTRYPAELLVVTEKLTSPSPLTVVFGRPVRVNDCGRPVRVMVRAAMPVDTTQAGATLPAGQLLPTVPDTTRLTSTLPSGTVTCTATEKVISTRSCMAR